MEKVHCSAPGRCGIIGNPTDMYGGTVISCSIEHRAHVTIEPCDHLEIETAGQSVVLKAPDDLVLNGVEVGGGSVRIHNPALQEDLFNIMGISKEEADLKFGFFLEALTYGAPPHAGMALGFDRLVATMIGVESLREIIAFPKTASATCPLTNAPSKVDKQQLDELGIALT